MRICYLNHDTRNNTGAGRFYNSFSAAVKRAIPGIDVEVLTSENILYPNKLKLFFALPVIRKILKRCDIIHALDGWPYGVIAALATFGLKKACEKHASVFGPGPDQKSRILDGSWDNANVPTRIKPKLIITAIGTGAVQPLYSWWRRPIMKWAYRRADRVVAVSNNTKKEILKFLPHLDISVINHGVDYNKFLITNYQLPITVTKPYILSVGALKKRKGYDYSIRAFAEAIKEIKKLEIEKLRNLKYVIVGNGPEKENLQLLITNYQLQERVKFFDNIDEKNLIALYQNAELFILLPQDVDKDIEGFGLAFLEAAAAGIPAIGVSESSAADAIVNEITGFLVPANNYQAAAGAMIKLLSNPDLKNKISLAAAESARKRSWDQVVGQYKKIYE